MGLTIRRGLQHFDRVGTPETLLRGVTHARDHSLSRERVTDEDDATLMTGDEYTAVGNIGNLELYERSDELTAAGG